MFTHFILEGLDPKSRPADKNKDKAVTLNEILDYAKARTVAETELAAVPQTPVVYGETQGTVYIVGSAPLSPSSRESGPGKKEEEKEPAGEGDSERKPSEETEPGEKEKEG
jgi:hypothetical protein